VTEYEILLMLDPELAEERQTEILDRIRALAEKAGGSWDGHDVWGRRRLAYEIDHKAEGSYHLLHLTCPPEALEEISRVLKIDDGVMRHLPTRRIEGSQIQSRPPEPVAVGVAAREDAGETEIESEPEPVEEE
jgi:small subunit ribosomal protein S6